MTVVVAAVVLAAGAGRRMGDRPKALLPIDKESFLSRVVSTCREGGCDEVWVVVPAVPPEVLALARMLNVRAVLNPAPERGMFSSVQVGVRAVTEAVQGTASVLVFPVDHPRVRVDTVEMLLEAREWANVRNWIRPRHKGQSGHPILVPGPATAGLLGRDPREPLRDALRGIGLTPLDVPVDDPGVVANLNTPEDFSG